MQDKLFDDSAFSLRRFGIVFLALTSGVGYIVGTIAASGADEHILSLMRTAANNCVSISGLLFTVLLPFFFTAIAVFFSKPWILFGLSFCKMFSFGFCASVLSQCFGSSAWIVELLLFFSDSWIILMLCGFWIRFLGGSLKSLSRDTAIRFISTVMICSLDYLFISPFLAELI